MGRKKKKITDDKTIDADREPLLQETTYRWVLAISLFVLCVFFILASLGVAGFVGSKLFGAFSALFGVGYYLMPLVFLMLSISIIMSVSYKLTYTRILGTVIFFISSLALIETAHIGGGGWVGHTLKTPVLKLVDIYACILIFIATFVIGIIIMFDGSILISSIFTSKKPEEVGSDEDERMSNNNPKIRVPEPEQKKIEAKINMPQENTKKENELIRMPVFKSASTRPFTPPPLSLLERDKGKPEVGDIKANANIIRRTLQNFGIVVEMDEISIGPSVTRYSLKPAEGVKLSKILGLQNNLELALAAHPVRIEAPIPGKSLVGIEIPNSVKTKVGLASILSLDEYSTSDKPLMMALGKGITGNGHFANLAKMPHLLIAGATGSGKSVTIHILINSLLFRNSPDNLKFIMIDPKRVELTLYNKIPHLLTPVVTDAKKAILALKWAAKEMDRRYNLLEENKVRDIESYHKNVLAPNVNKKDGEKPELMPYIVVIIDELADIMQAYPRELEAAIVRLAQMSRAVGIHLILSTQRPSVNVITGLIKANVPSRIALQVASQFDSRTILDTVGAEKLLGAGDMLYMSGEMSKPIRLQSPFISESEVKSVAQYLAKGSENDIPSEINLESEAKNNNLASSMFESSGDEDVDDDLYEEAKDTVVESGKASTSFLQRKLRIGYARAARLIDILEEKGIVGPGEGSKPREVLVKGTGNPTEEGGSEDQNENEL